MGFRKTYSRAENSSQARAESSLEAAILINGKRMGRIQGVRGGVQAGNRPVLEIGSDRTVEIVPGIKAYQGSAQSITIMYGDLVKRLASIAGGRIDAASKAAILTNMPDFDIVIMRRGSPGYNQPQLYSGASPSQQLSGTGGIVRTFLGCSITSADVTYGVQDPLLMESVAFMYVDEAYGDAAGGLESLLDLI
jgi:hypothetical protein